jgi:hypothetical protein
MGVNVMNTISSYHLAFQSIGITLATTYIAVDHQSLVEFLWESTTEEGVEKDQSIFLSLKEGRGFSSSLLFEKNGWLQEFINTD